MGLETWLPLPLAALLPTHPLFTSSQRFVAWVRIIVPIVAVCALLWRRQDEGFFSALYEHSVLTLLSPNRLGPIVGDLFDWISHGNSIIRWLLTSKLTTSDDGEHTPLALAIGQEARAGARFLHRHFNLSTLYHTASAVSFLEAIISLRIRDPKMAQLRPLPTDQNSPATFIIQAKNQCLRLTTINDARRRYVYQYHAMPGLLYMGLEFAAMAVHSLSIMDSWVHLRSAATVAAVARGEQVSWWDSMGYDLTVVLVGIAGFVPAWALLWWAGEKLNEAERDYELAKTARVVKKVHWNNGDETITNEVKRPAELLKDLNADKAGNDLLQYGGVRRLSL